MIGVRRSTLAVGIAALSLVAGPLTATALAGVAAPSDIFLTQPTDQTVVAGGEASFDAQADCDCTQQWQVSTDDGNSFSDVEAGTASPLTFTTTAAENGYQYRDVFTESQEDGANGKSAAAGQTQTFISNAATLTVNYPPSITQQPKDVTVGIGDPAEFDAAADGNPAPTIQWQVSTDGGGTWTDIDGATSESYVFTASLDQAGDLYRAVFTNSAVATPSSRSSSARHAADDSTVSVDSNPAKLKVVEPVPTPVSTRGAPPPEERTHPIHCGHYYRHEYVCPQTGAGTYAIEFTSADHAIFTEGTQGSFTVTASGNSLITDPPGWPSGIAFTPGRGTATISGTAAFGTAGTYKIPLKASLKSAKAHQDFTLTVVAAGSSLPFTGAPISWELAVAFMLLSGGLGLQLAARRRQVQLAALPTPLPQRPARGYRLI